MPESTVSRPENEREDVSQHAVESRARRFPWLSRGLSWRPRRLTVAVVGWIALVVSVAGYVVSHSDQGSPIRPTAASSLKSQLYVDPASQAATWVRAHRGSPQAAMIQRRIADQPTGKWFGSWSGAITPAVSQYVGAASRQHKVPVLVAYNLPERDCGGQSAGGAADPQSYATWIDGFAKGIAGRRALVILEPDALAMLDDCLDPTQQQARVQMLSNAVDRLESKNVWVYLDAGHSRWVPARQMAHRLTEAGIGKAHGFSLNVSNYYRTDAEAAYARQVNAALPTAKPYVIDTSRNGNGSRNDEWCNPAGAKLGTPPGTGSGAELLLWVKAPGESDGSCGQGAGSAAGQFVPKLANNLIAGR